MYFLSSHYFFAHLSCCAQSFLMHYVFRLAMNLIGLEKDYLGCHEWWRNLVELCKAISLQAFKTHGVCAKMYNYLQCQALLPAVATLLHANSQEFRALKNAVTGSSAWWSQVSWPARHRLFTATDIVKIANKCIIAFCKLQLAWSYDQMPHLLGRLNYSDLMRSCLFGHTSTTDFMACATMEIPARILLCF